jgi:hypothetical protein
VTIFEKRIFFIFSIGSPEMSKLLFSNRKRKGKEKPSNRNKKVVGSGATKITKILDFVLCPGFLYAAMKSTTDEPSRVMFKQERYPVSLSKKNINTVRRIQLMSLKIKTKFAYLPFAYLVKL